MANWLITGGCGFIGLNIVKRLLDECKQGEYNNIRIIDDMSVGKLSDISKLKSVKNNVLQIQENDIRDVLAVHHAMKDIDYVVHLAAISGVRPSVEDPEPSFESNVVGTYTLLESAVENKIKKFIFASSGAAVGEYEPPINEELNPKPVSPYGATKSCGEVMCHAFYKSYGLETVSLRFSNVYGPYSHRKESLIAKLVKRILDDETFNIYGDGKQTRDFIYVDDLVDVILLCAEQKNIGGELYQLCSSLQYPINEVIFNIIDIMSDKGYTNPKIKNIEEKIGDLKSNGADNSKIYKHLGWTPSVYLKNGLEKTIDWLIYDYENK